MIRIIRRKRLLISFFGPSGSGKTTCYGLAAEFLKARGLEVFRLDIAYPLRQIQCYAYRLFGKQSPGDPGSPENFRQDGALLGFLAKHFEASFSHTIQEAAQRIASRVETDYCVINTDCRNNAYPILKNMGFVFVRVMADPPTISARKAARGDITPFNPALEVEKYNLIEPAHLIINDGSLGELSDQIREILPKII